MGILRRLGKAPGKVKTPSTELDCEVLQVKVLSSYNQEKKGREKEAERKVKGKG